MIFKKPSSSLKIFCIPSGTASDKFKNSSKNFRENDSISGKRVSP